MSAQYRRFATVFFAFSLVALTACGTLNTVSGIFGNQITFTAPQLQRHLNNSFPREFDKLGGLVSATLSNPRLTLPANDHRLRLDFDIRVNAVGARDVARGRFALASGLRYDPATRGLHLQDPEIVSVEVPGSGSLMQGGTRGLVNAVLAEYAAQEPVYRIDSDLLNRLPSGKRIGSTNIENGLVVVHLDR